MISKYCHNEINWIDLEGQNKEEIAYIMDEYFFPQFIRDEIMANDLETKIKRFEGYIIISFSHPQFEREKSELVRNKISIILSNEYILTVHDLPVLAFSETLNYLELDTASGNKISNNELLFAYLLKNIYTNIEGQIIFDDIKIKKLERKVAKRNKRIMLLTRLTWIFFGVIILLGIYAITHI